MRKPIVKDLRSRTKAKAKDLTSKAKDFIMSRTRTKAKAKDLTSKAKDFIVF